jgi:hypothetical protein
MKPYGTYKSKRNETPKRTYRSLSTNITYKEVNIIYGKTRESELYSQAGSPNSETHTVTPVNKYGEYTLIDIAEHVVTSTVTYNYNLTHVFILNITDKDSTISSKVIGGFICHTRNYIVQNCEFQSSL